MIARTLLLVALSVAPGLRADVPLAQMPLLPEEVLAASEEHFPSILKALAQRQAAEGRVTESLGAFDLVFGADGFDRVDGFYDGTALSGNVVKPLRPLGAQLYGQYSLSNGDFPIYEDEYFTNNGGTAKLGVLFSMFRDRDIDSRRFGQIDAELALVQAQLDVLLTKVGVQQRALAAYWRWVAAGQELAVYDNLLRIALERETGLEREVSSGRRAAIFITENRQNITRRQTLMTASRRDFQVAANQLAFYLRDEDGEPLMPGAQRLPSEEQFGTLPPLPSASSLDVSSVLEQRPELRILQTGAERALQKIALSENELKPRLDLNLELAEGFGSIGEGGASRDGTDAIVGFTFSVPLERRQAKGKITQARAELESLRQEQRRLEDQVEIELRNILLELDTARQLMELAKQDVELSETMRRAEVRRFEQGASDFFLVNIREETAADARVRFYTAYQRTRVAQANFDAATVNLPRLGIDENY
ncbi:TolC family protein [Congregibacter variabilis]|uniref:TolC family protein n=1 Tax=Congregibacter variabilis TaxID=3081200 RepID=A0ABZ0I7A3_9GAMM|nr:TolC family protein [Congregibacter sp. IMCC43200]